MPPMGERDIEVERLFGLDSHKCGCVTLDEIDHEWPQDIAKRHDKTCKSGQMRHHPPGTLVRRRPHGRVCSRIDKIHGDSRSEPSPGNYDAAACACNFPLQRSFDPGKDPKARALKAHRLLVATVKEIIDARKEGKLR